MINRGDMLVSLLEGIKKEQECTANGWNPETDNTEKTVFDFLCEMENHVDEIFEQRESANSIEDIDIKDDIIGLWRLISKIRAKLGLPSSFFERPAT